MLTKTQIKETLDNAASLPLMIALLPGRPQGVQYAVGTRGGVTYRHYRLIVGALTLGEWSSQAAAIDGITWALAALDEQPEQFFAEADRLARETGRPHFVSFCVRSDAKAWVATHRVTDWPPADMSTLIYTTPKPATAGASHCATCGEPIDTAELCASCSKGNDPFFTSKYSGDWGRS